MNRSSDKKFQVFEFDDDDNGVELYNYKFQGGLGTRKTKKKREDSPITKYLFLQSFAGGTKIGDQDRVIQKANTTEEHCTAFLDIDTGDGNTGPLEDAPVKVEISRLDDSTHKIHPIATASSETRSSETTRLATSTFCTPKNQVPVEKQLIEPDFGGCEIDEKNMTVKIYPDFIICRDISLVQSCLTFSCNGIKLEGSTLDGTRTTFCSEWTNRDVMNIESDWNASVATAMVCLHLRSKNSKISGNANKTSGFEQLIFAVYDPLWSEGQEAIKTLDRRYRDKWNTEINMVSGEKGFSGGSSMFSQNQYFSSSDKPFQDVVYPKGDPDAVIIHKRDIELLEPERFINDTIIDFYIKYLARNLKSEEKQRFYFFNSFFFRKLADLDKDRSGAYEGKEAFQRVRKWTRKVNLFETDYIFIPVNYSLHWSLVVICYPGEVPNSEESENATMLPCILHMDSLRGSHKGLKNLIQSYLREEWKEKRNDAVIDASSRFMQMKFVQLELPQQENLFDCGLFLLHYVERFLEEAVLGVTPFNMSKLSNVFSSNWFLPEEASRKRHRIKMLIQEVFEDHSQNIFKADSIDRNLSRVPDGTCDQEAEVIFLEQIGCSTKTHLYASSSWNFEKVAVSSSESKADPSFRKSGCLVSLDISEQEACSSSYTDPYFLQSRTSRRGIIARIEHEVETDERVPESPLEKRKSLRKHEVYSFLNSPQRIDERVPESPQLYVEDSEEGETAKKHGFSDEGESKRPNGIEQYEQGEEACVASNLDEELADCVVEDSGEEDGGFDSEKLRCFHFTRNRRRRKRRFSSKAPSHSR